MTQKQRVLAHLMKYKRGITPLEAFERYGITRLSAVIFDLRKEHDIETETVKKRNRYGENCYVANYKLQS